jgi:hypothetical protein
MVRIEVAVDRNAAGLGERDRLFDLPPFEIPFW